MKKIKNEKEYFFDKPKNVKRFFIAYYTWLLFLLIVDPFIYKKAYFPWEKWAEFYAVFGFVACAGLVLAAGYILRPIVKRKEDYYD